MGIDFPLLTDEIHEIGDKYGVAVERYKHPRAWTYKKGFTQPAIFGYRGDEPIFNFVQKPGMLNLWGAARRPTAQQVLDAIAPKLQPADAN